MERAPSKPDPTGSALNRSGKLEPDKLDVAKKPKRKRKARNRKEPSDELRASESALERRALARPHPPGILLEPAGYDGEHFTAPHSDADLWTLQLAEAFGTRSQAVIHTFVNQLERLCGRNIWSEADHQWRLDESELSAALAMVNTLKPKNEMEAAHAAQMVAVHMMQMKLSARALKYDGEVKTAAVAGKLARTFNDQLRLAQELKGKGRTAKQSIKVTKETHHHQHMHWHRGEGENHGQPHTTDGGDLVAENGTGEFEERPALPSPRQVNREALQRTLGSGEASLPRPRSKGRRAEG